MNPASFSKDFLAGLLFVLIGLAAIGAAAYYPLGTARRIGPGMFPILIGGLMVLIGAGVALKALLAGRYAGEPPSLAGLRPLACILCGIGLFAVLAERGGLVIAMIALCLAAQVADRGARPLPTLVVALVVTAFIVPLFVWGLGVPFRLWPR